MVNKDEYIYIMDGNDKVGWSHREWADDMVLVQSYSLYKNYELYTLYIDMAKWNKMINEAL